MGLSHSFLGNRLFINHLEQTNSFFLKYSLNKNITEERHTLTKQCHQKHLLGQQ